MVIKLYDPADRVFGDRTNSKPKKVRHVSFNYAYDEKNRLYDSMSGRISSATSKDLRSFIDHAERVAGLYLDFLATGNGDSFQIEEAQRQVSFLTDNLIGILEEKYEASKPKIRAIEVDLSANFAQARKDLDAYKKLPARKLAIHKAEGRKLLNSAIKNLDVVARAENGSNELFRMYREAEEYFSEL
jgi:hypothetical protein